MILVPLIDRDTRYLLLSAGALLAGCTSKADNRPQRPPVTVSLAPVRRTSVPYTIEANGIVTPMQTAAVTPQVDGLITEVAFTEGRNVDKGQVLFRIDQRPYQAAHDQAVATLKRDVASLAYAKEQAARYDSLIADRSVTAEQAGQIKAAAASADATVQADQAALATAKFNLDNTTIRAPISGRTGGLLVHVGNVVHANGATPLVVINQVQPTLVRFAVPGAALPMLLKYGAKEGLPVTAVPADAAPRPASPDSARQRGDSALGAVPLRPVPGSAPLDPDERGTLSFIDNVVDTTTGTVQLKATFPNKSGTLWAGQFVSASLRLFVEENVLVVPTSAVVTGQNGTYVWVVDSSNVAHNNPVSVERTAGELSVISAGVTPQDRVVVAGQARLTPGANVSLGGRPDTTAGRRPGGGGKGKPAGGARGKRGAASQS